MRELIEASFRALYPHKRWVYEVDASYNNRFKPYGANVRKMGKVLEFRFSSSWRGVEESIVVGLIQELFTKVFREKVDSINIDLYNHFVKNLHLSIPKTNAHPILLQSFDRVNDKYFYGQVERPNLVLGGPSKRQLGSYDFKTDTITISNLFAEHPRVMDLIMHHELLHKQLKYDDKGGKARHHTAEFRRREKEFEDHEELEKLIPSIIRAHSRKPRRSSSVIQPILDVFRPK